MMTKKIALLLLLGFFLAPSLSRAEESALKTLPNRATQAVAGNLVNRVKNYADNVIARLNNALEHLMRLAERIKNHIALLKGRGLDVSAAEAQWPAAEAALTKAGDAITDLGAKLGQFATNNMATSTPAKPLPALTEVRAAIKTTVMALKDAHQQLIAVVKALRTVK